MLGLIIVIFSTISLIWYIKVNSHPKGFPPGPRLPLPLIGDGYVLGKDFNLGFTKLISKYGKNVGLWLGSNRTVVISDFETLKDILNLNETSDRGGMVEVAVEGKFFVFMLIPKKLLKAIQFQNQHEILICINVIPTKI